MAPSSSILLVIFMMILLVHLTEPKDGYSSLSRSRSSRRSSTTRRTYTNTYYTYNSYNTYSSHGRGLSWWQICLIVGGIGLGLLLIYICVRACRNQEPESDTPGIHTTREQIQLRDHQTIDPFQNTNYQDGQVIPPPPHMQQHYTPACPLMATAPPPSYDDALDISKEPIGEGGVDKWEEGPAVDRKDFGVI